MGMLLCQVTRNGQVIRAQKGQYVTGDKRSIVLGFILQRGKNTWKKF